MNLKKFKLVRLDVTLEKINFKIIDIDRGKFEQSFPRHMHPFYELHYIIGGKGRLLIDKEEYRLSEGDVFMTAPKIYHAQITDPNDYMEEYHIAFDISANSDFGKDALGYIFRDNAFYIAKDKFNVKQLFGLLENENESMETGYISAMTSIISLILLNTSRNFVQIKSNWQTKQLSADNRQLVLDEAFLYSYRDLTLHSLAEILHLDTRQTQRIIRQKYGMSFVELRTRMRLSVAQDMMRSGNASLSEIAEKCGFSSYAYFTKVFKKRFGMPPGQYRKNSNTFRWHYQNRSVCLCGYNHT